MRTRDDANTADVAATLGLGQASDRQQRRKRWIIATILLVAAVLAVVGLNLVFGGADPVQYRTVEVRRDDIVVTVTATGTLEPTNQVDVGSENSGIVRTVNVDYNDRVARNQILAVLDTERFEARVAQSRANVVAAQAAVAQADATVEETRAELARAEQLAAMETISPRELEAAEAALARAEATAASARAQVSVAEAVLHSDETTLRKATIRSPVDGIVLERNVEPGQTVAASFQAPVLFVLADDLSSMELFVDIDEADIGQVREGQAATFTVDAFPDRRFAATIISVYYAAETVDGVVTYPGVLEVENPDLVLRPGMTATADIVTASMEDVVLTPNAALRFTPTAAGDSSRAGSRVWTVRDGELVPISVTTGLSDGQWTHATGSDLEPGLPLVVGVLHGDGSSARNPSGGGLPQGTGLIRR